MHTGKREGKQWNTDRDHESLRQMKYCMHVHDVVDDDDDDGFWSRQNLIIWDPCRVDVIKTHPYSLAFYVDAVCFMHARMHYMLGYTEFKHH